MIYLPITLLIAMIFISSFRIVKTDHRGVIERYGKVLKFIDQGFHFIIPIIDQVRSVYIGEQVFNSPISSFQTIDNRIVNIDVKIFFHLKSHDYILIRALHEINNYPKDISIALQASLSKIIGDLPYSSINNYRLRIKVTLFSMMVSKLKLLDIEIDRVEINQHLIILKNEATK